MKQGEIDLFQLSLLGIAAVGGMMAGTCGALRRIMSTGEARAAIVIGYAFLGLSGGIVGAALGVFFPVFDVDSARAALVVGATFGTLIVVVLLGANFGSVMTFRFKGMRLTIEPDNTERRSTQRRHNQRRNTDRDGR